MKDLTNNRKFLKRTRIPSSSSVSEKDFHIDGHVILFSRNMKIVDYGDEETRSLLDAATEQTVVVIPTDLNKKGRVGDIVEIVEKAAQLSVIGIKAIRLDRSALREAGQIMGVDHPFIRGKGVATVVVFRGEGSLVKARQALEADGRYCSGVFSTSTTEEASKAQGLFLRQPPSADINNIENGGCAAASTCCVIKPHAIKARQVGPILTSIAKAGYRIRSMELFHLDHTAASEFLEVYEGGAVKNFHLMVEEMCSGPVIAMEICRSEGGNVGEVDMDVVSTFRKDVAGPWDVSVAKQLFPDTVRARFGVDNVRNAVHCTDLPTDGASECQFFFDILAGDRAESDC